MVYPFFEEKRRTLCTQTHAESVDFSFSVCRAYCNHNGMLQLVGCGGQSSSLAGVNGRGAFFTQGFRQGVRWSIQTKCLLAFSMLLALTLRRINLLLRLERFSLGTKRQLFQVQQRNCVCEIY